MGRNSPSARYHRALVLLAQTWRYRAYGPLVGPKEEHQPDPRWADLPPGHAPCFNGTNTEGEEPEMTRNRTEVPIEEARTPASDRFVLHCAACGVPVRSSGLAVDVTDALCGVTPDSAHTLDPRRVEVGPTTHLLNVNSPGAVFAIFATAEARTAYLAAHGHRYSYRVEWADVNGAGLHAVVEQVRGGQGVYVPSWEEYIAPADCEGCNASGRTTPLQTVVVTGPFGAVDQTVCASCARCLVRKPDRR